MARRNSHAFAGIGEIYLALVAEGFPDDYAEHAVRRTVPAGDDPRYLGWAKHLPDARAEAVRLLRSHMDTCEWNAGQLRRQADDAMAERDKLAAVLAKVEKAPP
jgi:hypothetical protein